MTKNNYYNKNLNEIYSLKEKAFKDSKDGISLNFMAANISFLFPYPVNLVLIMTLIIDSYKKYRTNKFFKKNFDDLYINSLEYQDVYQVYKIIIDELGNFFENQNADNEMKVFAMYYHMLRNGYLSVNHQFFFSTNIELELFLNGANIMEGKGKCLNISSMFTDILRRNNYDAWNLNMALTNKKIVALNDYFLEKEINDNIINDKKDKDEVFLETVEDFIGINHVATLVRDNKHSYIIDPTNNTLFLVDFDKQVYQSQNNYYVEYFKGFNKGIKNNISKMLMQTDCQLLETLINDYDKKTCECEKMTDLFEKFYKEHKCLYEEVVSKKKILLRENKLNSKNN